MRCLLFGLVALACLTVTNTVQAQYYSTPVYGPAIIAPAPVAVYSTPRRVTSYYAPAVMPAVAYAPTVQYNTTYMNPQYVQPQYIGPQYITPQPVAVTSYYAPAPAVYRSYYPTVTPVVTPVITPSRVYVQPGVVRTRSVYRW